MRLGSCAVSMAVLLGFAVAASAQTLEFTGDTLTVQADQPGASVILFSVAREPAGAIARVVSRSELLVDEDRDGIVHFAPRKGVVPRSIWIAVDLETGTIAAGTPFGLSPTPMRSQGAGEAAPVEGLADPLIIGREQVDVLLVRPRVGAWSRTLRDGGDADRDRQSDGRLHVDFSKLEPVHQKFASAPETLQPGDVIAVLDAARLEYWYGVAPRGEP